MAVSSALVLSFDLSNKRKTISQDVTAAGDVTDWQLFMKDIAIQVTGVATAVNLVVERSTRVPSSNANPAPVGDPITGNPATGIPVGTFYEPGAAFWRVRVVSMTGASANISISGQGN
jgi:hypothetical protein